MLPWVAPPAPVSTGRSARCGRCFGHSRPRSPTPLPNKVRLEEAAACLLPSLTPSLGLSEVCWEAVEVIKEVKKLDKECESQWALRLIRASALPGPLFPSLGGGGVGGALQ